MVVLLVIVLSLLALVVLTNWLRTGGAYDQKTGPVIGPEPPDWKPHEAEPWDEHPKLYDRKPSAER